MGATNTTTYYNLSQFVGTDKPAWLQDYNGDMLKIDTGINAAKVAADAAALDASAAQLDATTALGDITNTINPAITSLQTTVGNQGGAINTINSLIGNGTPTTTDQTIIGAINEINGKVSYSSVPITSATKYSDLTSAISNFSDERVPYVIAKNTSNTLTFFMPLSRMQSQNSLLRFAIAANAYTYELYISSTGTELNEYTISSATTNNLISASWDIKLYY